MAGKPNRRKSPTNTYWRGEVLWFRASVNGIDHRESLHTSDVKTASKRATRILNRLNARRHGEDNPEWEEVVTEWAEYISAKVTATTAARYATSLEMLKPYFTGKPISEIDKALINVAVSGRKRDGVSNATIRRDLCALSSVLDFAEDKEWRDGNPALDKARRINEKRDPIVLPALLDILATIAACKQPLADLAKLAMLTGCRLNELVTLQRRNVRLKSLSVLGKGNKLRSIEIDDEAQRLIARQTIALKCPYVFHVSGTDLGDVSSAWRRASKQAHKSAQKFGTEFRALRFHDLRHFFAVEYLRDGGSIYDLQHHLGHTSVLTTEIYVAFLTPEEAKASKAARTKDGTRT